MSPAALAGASRHCGTKHEDQQVAEVCPVCVQATATLPNQPDYARLQGPETPRSLFLFWAEEQGRDQDCLKAPIGVSETGQDCSKGTQHGEHSSSDLFDTLGKLPVLLLTLLNRLLPCSFQSGLLCCGGGCMDHHTVNFARFDDCNLWSRESM